MGSAFLNAACACPARSRKEGDLMYAAIYFPEAPASREVLAEEAMIVLVEGSRHVCGRYYADERDAAVQRRWEAERRIRERATTCAYCSRTFDDGAQKKSFGGCELHVACFNEIAADYDEWAVSTDANSCPGCGRPNINDCMHGLCDECLIAPLVATEPTTAREREEAA
jgi:hypothetical protein